MEDATQCLIQLVEFVNFFTGRHVPQHSVGQNQLVGRIEGSSILVVLITLTRLQSHQFRSAYYVVNLRIRRVIDVRSEECVDEKTLTREVEWVTYASVRPSRADQLIFGSVTEFEELFIIEGTSAQVRQRKSTLTSIALQNR